MSKKTEAIYKNAETFVNYYQRAKGKLPEKVEVFKEDYDALLKEQETSKKSDLFNGFFVRGVEIVCGESKR